MVFMFTPSTTTWPLTLSWGDQTWAALPLLTSSPCGTSNNCISISREKWWRKMSSQDLHAGVGGSSPSWLW